MPYSDIKQSLKKLKIDNLISIGWIPGLRIAITFLFMWFFLFPIIGTDSVNHAESGDTKSLI